MRMNVIKCWGWCQNFSGWVIMYLELLYSSFFFWMPILRLRIFLVTRMKRLKRFYLPLNLLRLASIRSKNFIPKDQYLLFPLFTHKVKVEKICDFFKSFHNLFPPNSTNALMKFGNAAAVIPLPTKST